MTFVHLRRPWAAVVAGRGTSGKDVKQGTEHRVRRANDGGARLSHQIGLRQVEQWGGKDAVRARGEPTVGALGRLDGSTLLIEFIGDKSAEGARTLGFLGF